MKKWLLRTLCLFLGLFILANTIGAQILEFPVTLLFGWLYAVQRLTQHHLDPSFSALAGLAAGCVLLCGTHGFLSWLYAALRSEAAPGKWRLKWSLCGFGILLGALLAIGSLILTTHQVFWLSRSSTPMFHNRLQNRAAIIQATHRLVEAGDKFGWDAANLRRTFLKLDLRNNALAYEDIRPIWIEDQDQTIRCVILVPRRPVRNTSARISVIEPGKPPQSFPLNELDHVLQRFGLGSAATSNQMSARL